ncbi:LacI family transcriptional regulator [Isoptericola jiangsuensis]|uniref:LacI family transcriptional regulator n=1 Tax=Isoptericola jiangsuensis TaxID=548579 RepID=A0A2A9EVT5_9MICO|nr:LacI family DNA-binding transcriptional regulator [Isoptericola jiangsuensis]PFG42863.1 LacI family transcriptional regulator [Isoptericola jiangsuensis]
MPSVTSADVARAAGVSRTTVSYVLNDTPGVSVSQATRQHVRDTAARLGYAPSAAARTLRRGRSDLVVCVLPDWPTGPVVDLLLDHLTDVLAERGLFVLVHHHRDSRALTDLWRAVTPRAVVGLAPFTPDEARAMAQAGIVVVGTVQTTDDDAFDRSQHDLAALQVDHLAARGHRRVAVAATDDPRLARFAQARLAGVRDACAARSLPAPVSAPVPVDRPATDVVRDWHETGVTAVAAYNDEVALAVLAGAREAGLDVPADLAVIGVDDSPAARVSAPPLTTVAQPILAQSDHLAAGVLAAIDGTAAPSWPADPAVVVVRGSA